jgi:cobalt-zinc-cadmium efflux system protein
VSLSAHLRLDSLEQWPRILEDARRVLDERFDIDHVTLQPELSGDAHGAHAVIQVFRRR